MKNDILDRRLAPSRHSVGYDTTSITLYILATIQTQPYQPSKLSYVLSDPRCKIKTKEDRVSPPMHMMTETAAQNPKTPTPPKRQRCMYLPMQTHCPPPVTEPPKAKATLNRALRYSSASRTWVT